VGALCATGLGRSFVVGAILGAVAAVLGTFATFQIRRTLVKDRGLPDLPVALVEDAVTLAVSVLVLVLMTR
jgi:uncharacterized membrane protein